jgi:heptosyltransferase-2
MASRILIVAPAWVGDAVISQPMLSLLKARAPMDAIEVLAPPWVAPLYRRMTEVDAVFESPFPHGQLALGRRRAVAAALRTRAYDRAIVLPNSLKSALIPWMAGIPKRIGYLGEQRYGLLNDRRRLDKAQLPRLVDRFAALALPPGDPLPPQLPQPRLAVDLSNQAIEQAKFGLKRQPPIVALCPGAEYGPAKRWPPAYFADIAQLNLSRGRQVWIFGSGNDATVGAEIVAAAPGAINLCGRTSLADAIDLIALAERVVTNDSGLMHVAAAAGCEVIALFGSTTPDYTPPLSKRARTISLKLECSPCFERTCPLGHTNCLVQMKPERVIDEMDIAASDPSSVR